MEWCFLSRNKRRYISNRYIINLEGEKLYFNSTNNEDNANFKDFVKKCLYIANYGDYMLNEYEKDNNNKIWI